jgi:uncharacterized Zn finger protein
MSQIPPAGPGTPDESTQSIQSIESIRGAQAAQPGAPDQSAPTGGPPRPAQRFDRRPAKPTLKPRRVLGGVRLTARKPGIEAPWVVQRWMRLVESAAPGDQLAEGLEYARLGQARSLDVAAGSITARVQGRLPRAYSTVIRMPLFTHTQWEPVIGVMLEQARYAASLLAGELPANIEDLFVPFGLKLFPAGPSDLAIACNCAVFAEGQGPWCKHACCVMALVADRLAADPFLIFTLRGLRQDDLIESLRQRRVAGSAKAVSGSSPIYTPHLPGIADRQSPALQDCLSSFWSAGPGLDDLDLPIEPPDVVHPLLRRIGPSPFAGAKFPLVGLLATCYDLISQSMLSKEEGKGDPPGE